jgi:CheY-like chemotaxis protein
LRGSETILIVEDDEQVRRLAARTLARLGYRVIEAAGGGAALLQCENEAEAIDVLLTDVVMPEMSGKDLADRLCSLRKSLKVLYMSGYTYDSMTHRGILDEGVHVLQKPFTTNALARKIREVIDA